MKHRRSIDLTASADIGYTVSEGSRRSGDYDLYPTLDKLPEWYVLLGWCQRCRRYGHIERRDVRRALGAAALLADIQPHLFCTVCHERRGNKLSIRKLPR
ncbi:hypothetical protein AWJ14_19640 [Hoeflea olei]|uniref:Uncharacterized protein n=1 Tax=Hoeflea olei TaxID=1480615 RepID=A0A1C1YSH7_9HYPH|nr:hypothetical protein AWJ14_19640 [Hoeflea olei]